jgi:hypothetical protein
MNKKIGFVFLLSALIIVLLSIPLVVTANHAWANYHWERSSNPVSLDLGDNVSSVWDGHLTIASADWSESSVLDTTVVTGSAKGKCRPTDGMVEVCNDTYGNNGWLGLAQIWVSGDHITQGVTKVNDTYFAMPTYDTPAWRQLVMCQEIGHNFGLGHQDENFNNPNLGSCMDYTGDPSSNQHPNQHDYEVLGDIYAHLDVYSGGGGGDGVGSNCPPRNPNCNNGNTGNNGQANGDLHSQAEWGQLVRSEGRTAVYERDFGYGNRVITFVIWAD